MTGACFDSVIIIDLIAGRLEARLAFEAAPHQQRFISTVSRTEVLTGARSPEEWRRTQLLLARFVEVVPDAAIADAAARLRQRYRLKTPDAIIAATAAAQGVPLLTRDAALVAVPGSVLAYA